VKRLVLILAVLLAATLATAEGLKVSGDSNATVYHDFDSVGVLDIDQNAKLELWKLSLALNAGFTHDFGALTDVISWGYTLGYAQAFGPFSVSASLASDGMKYTFGGAYAGNLLDDIKAGVDFAKEPFGANASVLFSAVKGYEFFQGTDISVAYLPKWGSFRIGGTFLDAQAVTDDVGYSNAIAAVEGFSLYAKAKVTY